jgi:hypothetical protein
MQTFRLTLDFVDPSGLIKFSREREEDPTHRGRVRTRFEHEQEFWERIMRLEEVTCPSLRCPPYVFGVARRETEAGLRTQPSRSLKRCGKGKDVEREQS